MSNNEWSAYLAGVLDADGSFTISQRHAKRPNPNYISMIQLSWSESELSRNFIKLLVEKYGGSYFSSEGLYKGRYPNGKPILKYCGVGKSAEKICNDVLPFLVLKKEQAKNLLKLREVTSSFTGSRPKECSDQLNHLYTYNRKLNSKNKGIICT
jgi:hypothetical protein